MDSTDPTAGWWAGDSEEHFQVGPFATKHEAIDEAFFQEYFEEVEIEPGVWVRRVYYAEAGGLHFDCEECGIVEKACDECVNYLYPEEAASVFSWSRNDGYVDRKYEDDQ